MTRTAAEIAAGLAPPRPARPIEPGTRLHVMGVGGAASAGAALHAAAVGAVVTACDGGGPDPLSRVVEGAGVPIWWENAPVHVRRDDGTAAVDRLAVTKAVTSVDPDHPELAAARAAGITPESVQQVIADAAATRGQRLIGVTGTHGKSTTSGWLLHLLVAAGRDPAGFVGAQLPSSITGGARGVARFGTGPDFVVEADEYAGNFDPYLADIAVLDQRGMGPSRRLSGRGRGDPLLHRMDDARLDARGEPRRSGSGTGRRAPGHMAWPADRCLARDRGGERARDRTRPPRPPSSAGSSRKTATGPASRSRASTPPIQRRATGSGSACSAGIWPWTA